MVKYRLQTPLDKDKELRELLEELCQVDEGLTSWECDFVDSVSSWEGLLTTKQGETIEKIHKKLFG